MTTKVTIGWTLNHDGTPYSSFLDGWAPTAPQHKESFTVEGADDLSPEQVAEYAFIATNAPYDLPALAVEILSKVEAAGWDGHVDDDDLYGHFSLSVGDTVEVDGVLLECKSLGWSRVETLL